MPHEHISSQKYKQDEKLKQYNLPQEKSIRPMEMYITLPKYYIITAINPGQWHWPDKITEENFHQTKKNIPNQIQEAHRTQETRPTENWYSLL